MRRSGLDERRADARSSMLRKHEDALDLRGTAEHYAGPGNSFDECQPRHANELTRIRPGDKRKVRSAVCAPPLLKIDSECLDGLARLLLRCRVKPEQARKVRHVLGLSNPHVHEPSLSERVAATHTVVQNASSARQSAT